MKKLKIGLIGIGYIGCAHVTAIRRCPNAILHAVADTDRQLLERKKEELGLEKVYDNVDEMLADPEIDVIHDCTPNHMHLELNRKIIQAGKHVFSEKPVAASAKESAKQQVALIHIVKQKMDELGLSLSYSQKKNIVTANKQNAEQLGGEDAYLQRLASIGFDMDHYNNYQYVSACAQVLKDYYFGENGVSVPSDDELQKYFDDNYITAKHILILTKNPSTGETTRTDEEAKKEAQAVLDRLNNGEDFDALLTEKNEDAGEAQYAKGYTFTEGQMVDEFYNAAKALQEGEVSGLVKSQYGYHIIKRCELNQDEFENMRDAIIAAVASEKGTAGSIDEMMQQWIDEADIQTTDAYDEITYDNTKDYLPADVQTVLNSDTSDDDGNAQTEDAQSEDQSATDSQSSTDEAQTADTEAAQ